MLMNQILINMPFSYDQKQKVLEIEDISGQCGELVALIMNEAQIAAIRTQLAVKIREKIDKNQKDYILREQMEYIQEELGDKNQYSDVQHYEEALAKLKADAEVKEKIQKEINRFRTIMGSSSESAVERGISRRFWSSRGTRLRRTTMTSTGRRRSWREITMGLRR